MEEVKTTYMALGRKHCQHLPTCIETTFPLGIDALGTPPMSPWPGAASQLTAAPFSETCPGRKALGIFAWEMSGGFAFFWGQPDNKAQRPLHQSSAWDQAGARPYLCLPYSSFPHACFPSSRNCLPRKPVSGSTSWHQPRTPLHATLPTASRQPLEPQPNLVISFLKVCHDSHQPNSITDRVLFCPPASPLITPSGSPEKSLPPEGLTQTPFWGLRHLCMSTALWTDPSHKSCCIETTCLLVFLPL